MNDLVIRESIHGNFYYHLAEKEQITALCGKKNTMSTRIPLSYWGEIGHLHERYCPKCNKKFKSKETYGK